MYFFCKSIHSILVLMKYFLKFLQEMGLYLGYIYIRSYLVYFFLWWKSFWYSKDIWAPIWPGYWKLCALPPDFTFSSLPFPSDSYYQWYEMLCTDRYWQVLIKIHFTSPAITSKEQRSFLKENLSSLWGAEHENSVW